MSEHPVFDMGTCSTPCSDAAGTCSELCPHLDLNEDGPALAREERAIRISRETKRSARRRRREKRRSVKAWKRMEAAPEKERARQQFYRELRCFWTWPLGHVYEKTPVKSAKVCMACGKTVQTGSYGGGY